MDGQRGIYLIMLRRARTHTLWLMSWKGEQVEYDRESGIKIGVKER